MATPLAESDTAQLELENARKLQRRRQILKRVFGTPEGQEAMTYIKEIADFDGPTFTRQGRGNHTAFDPYAAALKDGGRGLIIAVQRILCEPSDSGGNSEEKKPVKKGLTNK